MCIRSELEEAARVFQAAANGETVQADVGGTWIDVRNLKQIASAILQSRVRVKPDEPREWWEVRNCGDILVETTNRATAEVALSKGDVLVHCREVLP